jgi:hypothetical protein
MLVQDFTTRKLPHGNDKLPALIGLVKDVETVIDDIFVNNLWKRDLQKGVLWQAGRFPKTEVYGSSQVDLGKHWPFRRKIVGIEQTWTRGNTHDDLTLRFAMSESGFLATQNAEPVQRAPSWSWVSVDGDLIWGHIAHIGATPHFEIMGLDPEVSESSYGIHNSGLVVRSLLRRINCIESRQRPAQSEDTTEQSGGTKIELLTYRFEVDISQAPSCFLLLAREVPGLDNEAEHGCLLLQPVKEQKPEFIRIGMCWTTKSKSDASFEDRSLQSGLSGTGMTVVLSCQGMHRSDE